MNGQDPLAKHQDYLFATAARTFLMTPATELRTTDRSVVISNQVESSLDIAGWQASMAVAVVLTGETLFITRTHATIKRTLW